MDCRERRLSGGHSDAVSSASGRTRPVKRRAILTRNTALRAIREPFGPDTLISIRTTTNGPLDALGRAQAPQPASRHTVPPDTVPPLNHGVSPSMERSLKSVGCLVTFTLISACAATTTEPRWSGPAVVPAGWAADYDYVSALRQYLRGQHDRARLEGATAYVYIYRDSNKHCIGIRQLMERGMVAAAFHNVRITMLSYDRLKWLYPRRPSVAFDPGNEEAIFVKIAADGGLSDSIFYAHLYRYHPEALRDFGYSDPIQPTLSEYAEALQKFFETSAEI